MGIAGFPTWNPPRMETKSAGFPWGWKQMLWSSLGGGKIILVVFCCNVAPYGSRNRICQRLRSRTVHEHRCWWTFANMGYVYCCLDSALCCCVWVYVEKMRRDEFLWAWLRMGRNTAGRWGGGWKMEMKSVGMDVICICSPSAAVCWLSLFQLHYMSVRLTNWLDVLHLCTPMLANETNSKHNDVAKKLNVTATLQEHHCF